MSKLWIGNFSFEDELQGRNSKSQKIRRFQAELVPCLAGAANSNDIILCPEVVSDEFSVHLNHLRIDPPQFLTFEQILELRPQISEIQPWGWSQAIYDQMQHIGEFQIPSIHSVRIANSRQFSHELSLKLDCHIEGECEVFNISDLDSALNSSSFESGFVIKSKFGQSGRGQIVRNRAGLTDQDLHRIQRHLDHDGAIYLEPKLNPVAEFGVQWNIRVNQEPTLLGVTKLQSDHRGQYSGSIISFDQSKFEELDHIIAIQRKVVSEIQSIGYFGPVGIDAMIYQDQNNHRRTRPLQDINARWTMGRLAMSWANQCFPGKDNVYWAHSPTLPCPAAVRTSPVKVGEKTVLYQTWCYPIESLNV